MVKTHEINLITSVFNQVQTSNYIILEQNKDNLFEANDSQTLKIKQDENKDVKWININDLESFISDNDIDMIPIYRKVLRQWKTN